MTRSPEIRFGAQEHEPFTNCLNSPNSDLNLNLNLISSLDSANAAGPRSPLPLSSPSRYSFSLKDNPNANIDELDRPFEMDKVSDTKMIDDYAVKQQQQQQEAQNRKIECLLLAWLIAHKQQANQLKTPPHNQTKQQQQQQHEPNRMPIDQEQSNRRSLHHNNTEKIDKLENKPATKPREELRLNLEQLINNDQQSPSTFSDSVIETASTRSSVSSSSSIASRRVEPMLVITTPQLEWPQSVALVVPTRARQFSTPLTSKRPAASMSRLQRLQISLVVCLLLLAASPILRAAFGAPTQHLFDSASSSTPTGKPAMSGTDTSSLDHASIKSQSSSDQDELTNSDHDAPKSLKLELSHEHQERQQQQQQSSIAVEEKRVHDPVASNPKRTKSQLADGHQSSESTSEFNTGISGTTNPAGESSSAASAGPADATSSQAKQVQLR